MLRSIYFSIYIGTPLKIIFPPGQFIHLFPMHVYMIAKVQIRHWGQNFDAKLNRTRNIISWHAEQFRSASNISRSWPIVLKGCRAV